MLGSSISVIVVVQAEQRNGAYIKMLTCEKWLFSLHLFIALEWISSHLILFLGKLIIFSSTLISSSEPDNSAPFWSATKVMDFRKCSELCSTCIVKTNSVAVIIICWTFRWDIRVEATFRVYWLKSLTGKEMKAQREMHAQRHMAVELLGMGALVSQDWGSSLTAHLFYF